jgi:hypothetical protein
MEENKSNDPSTYTPAPTPSKPSGYDKEAKWGHAATGDVSMTTTGETASAVREGSGGNAPQPRMYVFFFHSFFTNLTWFLHNKEGQVTTGGAPAEVEHPRRLAGNAGKHRQQTPLGRAQAGTGEASGPTTTTPGAPTTTAPAAPGDGELQPMRMDCHRQGGAPTMTRDR